MEYKCYIDESGDEGIGTGGSRWFILGALIIPQEREDELKNIVIGIQQRLEVKVLHWYKLKKHQQKIFLCQELLNGEWAYCCIATDKNHPNVLNAPNMKRKDQLYCYSVKLLFERLSWYARDNGNRIATPIFEYRSSTSYSDMESYIEKLSNWIPADAVTISWGNINYKSYRLLPKNQSELLQACDCITGAVKDALEFGRLGIVEPTYILKLQERLYRRGGNLFSYGFKFLHVKPRDMKQIKDEYEWLQTI